MLRYTPLCAAREMVTSRPTDDTRERCRVREMYGMMLEHVRVNNEIDDENAAQRQRREAHARDSTNMTRAPRPYHAAALASFNN